MQNKLSAFVVAMMIILIASPGLLSAQSIWLDRRHDKTISVEILKPNFDGDDNTTFATSTIFLSLRYPVAEGILFVTDLPFAHYGIDSDYRDVESQNALGNPYLGLELANPNSPFFTEIGLNVPLMSEEKLGASWVGRRTELIGRVEAFYYDVVPIKVTLNRQMGNAEGFASRLRVGPSYWAATGDRDESEVFLLYSAQIEYMHEGFCIGGGIAGWWILTEDNSDFGQDTYHNLGFIARIVLGNIRPGIHIRLPLDEDVKEYLDFVFGVNLGIHLN